MEQSMIAKEENHHEIHKVITYQDIAGKVNIKSRFLEDLMVAGKKTAGWNAEATEVPRLA